jgi:tetratricopeptide (TPR) repeat protein
MLLAREYLLRKDNKKGLEEFLEVLKMPDINKPNKRLVLLNSLLQVAFIYEEEKNFDEAIWYCQEFIKEDQSYREPYFLMGEMYNLMKMYTLSEAIVEAGFEYGKQHFDWVERGNTWLGWGNDLLSVAKFNLGKYDEAVHQVEIALKHEPNDIRILKNYNAMLKACVNKK